MSKNYSQAYVLIVSPIAPPIGGNSVHARRLLDALLSLGIPAKALDYQAKERKTEYVFVLRGGLRRKWQELKTIRNALAPNTIIHFHTSAFGKFKWLAPVLLTLFRHHPRVITIHSGSFVEQTDHLFLRQYIAQLLHHFDAIIVVNEVQQRYLVDLGLRPQKIWIIPAFIPEPIQATEGKKYLEQLPKGKMIVVTSGYLTPLYNYDVLVDCIDRLSEDEYHFVFAFYNRFDSQYTAHILQRLEKHNNITILKNQDTQTFLNVLAHSDVYVRPTLTDGDAVAIREALAIGKIVLASNSVKRPDECLLFPADDVITLCDLLKNISQQSQTSNRTALHSNTTVKTIIGVYQHINAKFPPLKSSENSELNEATPAKP